MRRTAATEQRMGDATTTRWALQVSKTNRSPTFSEPQTFALISRARRARRLAQAGQHRTSATPSFVGAVGYESSIVSAHKLSLRKAEPTATRDFITTAQPTCSQRTNSTNCRRQKNLTMPQSVARAAAPLSTPFASSNRRSRWPRGSTRPAQTLSNPPLPVARRPIHPCWSQGRRALLSAHGLSGRPVPRLLAKRSGT